MGEMDVLKQRMEHAALRLRTAHSARERECNALNETWERIRARFAEQAAETTALRARVAELENEKDDLAGMVRGLLAAIEDGVEHMRDGTVPRIAAMAGELLEEGRTAPVPARADRAERTQPGASETTRKAAMPETGTERTAGDGGISGDDPDGQLEVDFPEPAGESLSPGIRNLIGRIEDSFGGPAGADGDGVPEDEDELARDLREIESLRNELNGLRARISE